MDLQPIKDALGTLKRSNGQPKEGNDLAEAMDEFIGQVPTWLAQLVAEVERLRAFAADVAETADARFCLPGGQADSDWERLGEAAHGLAQPTGQEVGHA